MAAVVELPALPPSNVVIDVAFVIPMVTIQGRAHFNPLNKLTYSAIRKIKNFYQQLPMTVVAMSTVTVLCFLHEQYCSVRKVWSITHWQL